MNISTVVFIALSLCSFFGSVSLQFLWISINMYDWNLLPWNCFLCCLYVFFFLLLLLLLKFSHPTKEQAAIDVHKRADKRCTKNSVTKVHANEFLIHWRFVVVKFFELHFVEKWTKYHQKRSMKMNLRLNTISTWTRACIQLL